MKKDEIEIGNKIRDGWDELALKELDEIMSESSSDGEWAVLPLAKPPIDKGIADFLERARQSFFENPGIPLCSGCLSELKLNEDENIWCPNCEWVIPVIKD